MFFSTVGSNMSLASRFAFENHKFLKSSAFAAWFGASE